MQSDTIELVERVHSRLKDDHKSVIAGPVDESEIVAAEAALGCTFPPSYRTFLQKVGGLHIPVHLGIVHDFVGLVQTVAPAGDVVGRTLAARANNKLPSHLLVVGMGAAYQEWFCLDTAHPTSTGEFPIVLFDAKDNALDQQFYDDFGQMLQEVMGFVADSLEQPLD